MAVCGLAEGIVSVGKDAAGRGCVAVVALLRPRVRVGAWKLIIADATAGSHVSSF
jgi:hypothetical protein